MKRWIFAVFIVLALAAVAIVVTQIRLDALQEPGRIEKMEFDSAGCPRSEKSSPTSTSGIWFIT